MPYPGERTANVFQCNERWRCFPRIDERRKRDWRCYRPSSNALLGCTIAAVRRSARRLAPERLGEVGTSTGSGNRVIGTVQDRQGTKSSSTSPKTQVSLPPQGPGSASRRRSALDGLYIVRMQDRARQCELECCPTHTVPMPGQRIAVSTSARSAASSTTGGTCSVRPLISMHYAGQYLLRARPTVLPENVMLAYYVEWHMRQRTQVQLLSSTTSEPDVRGCPLAYEVVAPAEVSPVGPRPSPTKRTASGKRVHSYGRSDSSLDHGHSMPTTEVVAPLS